MSLHSEASRTIASEYPPQTDMSAHVWGSLCHRSININSEFYIFKGPEPSCTKEDGPVPWAVLLLSGLLGDLSLVSVLIEAYLVTVLIGPFGCPD